MVAISFVIVDAPCKRQKANGGRHSLSHSLTVSQPASHPVTRPVTGHCHCHCQFRGWLVALLHCWLVALLVGWLGRLVGSFVCWFARSFGWVICVSVGWFVRSFGSFVCVLVRSFGCWLIRLADWLVGCFLPSFVPPFLPPSLPPFLRLIVCSFVGCCVALRCVALRFVAALRWVALLGEVRDGSGSLTNAVCLCGTVHMSLKVILFCFAIHKRTCSDLFCFILRHRCGEVRCSQVYWSATTRLRCYSSQGLSNDDAPVCGKCPPCRRPGDAPCPFERWCDLPNPEAVRFIQHVPPARGKKRDPRAPQGTEHSWRAVQLCPRGHGRRPKCRQDQRAGRADR